MHLDTYQGLAGRTANPELGYEKRIAQGVFGLNGESGETTDLLKKHLYHGHELDRDRLQAELGDVLWYVAELASATGLSLSEIAAANIAKLQARYPGGFSAERSINREVNNG